MFGVAAGAVDGHAQMYLKTLRHAPDDGVAAPASVFNGERSPKFGGQVRKERIIAPKGVADPTFTLDRHPGNRH
ncbi:Uncharacterised protein [Mycobacteroides abscessus subsp. abscessus]|nr:Uncharacterised protein [Mycobacteroides abscessus subsp. abscessus]